MAQDVQWIKFKVGTFDGNSFKRIKRAKIEGIMNFRDKLTAVWFELLDLGGKVNNDGFLINDEIAFISYEDIAIALDREEKEIELCINWFTQNNMMEIINDIYLISNWTKYQNNDGLEKIREQNRIRQQNYRERNKQLALENNDNVSVTLRNAPSLISKSKSLSNSSSLYKTIIDYLNNKLNTHYRYTSNKTQSLIKARLNEGFTYDDFVIVIDKKYDEWKDDEKMSKFLRTETLFGTRFEQYLNQQTTTVKEEVKIKGITVV